MMEKYNLYRQGIARFQTIATTTSSQQSTALTGSIINITTGDDLHYISIGANPTADTTSFVLPANSSFTFSCNPGDRVAVRCHNGANHISILDN